LGDEQHIARGAGARKKAAFAGAARAAQNAPLGKKLNPEGVPPSFPLCNR